MPGSGSKAATKLAGVVIVSVALVFVARQLVSGHVAHLLVAQGPLILAALLAGVVVYTLGTFVLAAAWHGLLGNLSFGEAMSLYGRSQIAKYVPGNIAHFAWRHALGRAANMGHTELAGVAVLEFLSLIAAATTFALVGSAVLGVAADVPTLLGMQGTTRIMLLAAGAVLAACGAGWTLRRRGRWPTIPWSQLARSYGLHLLFFAMCGLILLGVASAVKGPEPLPGLLPTVSIAALAWLAGFVTPGASAGIGVREACLILLLKPSLGPDAAALAAVVYRIVTILGDVACFGFATVLPRRFLQSRTERVNDFDTASRAS